MLDSDRNLSPLLDQVTHVLTAELIPLPHIVTSAFPNLAVMHLQVGDFFSRTSFIQSRLLLAFRSKYFALLRGGKKLAARFLPCIAPEPFSLFCAELCFKV